MGVHGLWKLIDSAGKAIPLEALENRVLAVDVSIWLYQLVKGFQERAGHSVANAYLLGLFHRICKLLFYRIKPIFVFDGGVPSLKRKTIAARQNNRAKASLMSEKLRQALLENLVKQEALGKALGENVALPKLFQPKQDTLFSLPALPISEEAEHDSDKEEEKGKYRYKDLQSIDITSEEFLSLPADMRHDILNELKETRKENSWAKLHLMPEVGDEFSDFQMRRLLKRRAIQVGIEKAESEMGTRGFTISDLQTILSDQGVELAQRIAADSSTRLLYNKKVKELTKDISSEASTSQKIQTKKDQSIKFMMESDDSSSAPEDDIYSSEEESNDKSLTQAEILELIKQENLSSKGKDVEDSIDKNGSELKIEKTEEGPKLAVNVEAAENEPGNNAVQLEHGTFPQEGSNSHKLSFPAPLYNPQISFRLLPPPNEDLLDEANSIHSIESNPRDLINASPDIIDEDSVKDNLEPMDVITNPEIANVCMMNMAEKKLIDQVKLSIDENKSANETEQNSNALEESPTLDTTKEQNSSESEESDNDFIEIGDEESIEADDQRIFSSEVKDKPLYSAEVASTAEKHLTSVIKPLEIVLSSANSLEDDLFADVFNNRVEKLPLDEEHIFDENGFAGKAVNPSNSDSLPVPKSPKETDVKLIGHDFKQNEKNIQPSDEGNVSSPVPQLTVKEIVKLKQDLEYESGYLMEETSKEDRIASTITEQIRMDAQELLRLFGVPYIIAPLEAEAQCAYLDLTGQTQGTITDDSDIWLFGGNNVYKNFFDQKKFVQQFKATDITKCLQIGRDEMIMLALLSGSDYTLGLMGVGAVTALEVIAHYPKSEREISPVERLKNFAKDFKTKALFSSIAKKLKKTTLSEGFPCAEVVNAYLDPEVDKSSEAFSWSKPNVKEIRRYARDKFGWDQNKTDKILQPVLENLQKTQTQGTLHRFFDWKFDNLENTRSKRVENALNLLKTPSLLSAPGTSTSHPPVKGNKKYAAKKSNDLLVKSETPAQAPSTITSRPPIRGNMKYAAQNDLLVKSKTPAQIARERAAKKFKELKKQGKIGPKSKNK